MVFWGIGIFSIVYITVEKAVELETRVFQISLQGLAKSGIFTESLLELAQSLSKLET